MKFAIGGLLGGLASLTISFGPIALLATVAFVLLAGIAWRSQAALSGVLCGFGLTWLVLIGSGYTRCVSMGRDCVGSESMVPFLVIAGVVFLAGVAAGLLGIIRARAARQGVRGGAL